MPISVAIDFETADYGADSACAVGMARIEEGRIVGTFYRLIRPPRRRILFTWVHGLTWEMLKGEDTFFRVWPDMDRFMHGAEYLIAHNASFDRRVLVACLQNKAEVRPFLCTLKGSRAMHSGLAHHRLNDVCRYFGIALEHHHNAMDDAVACAEISIALMGRGVGIREMLL